MRAANDGVPEAQALLGRHALLATEERWEALETPLARFSSAGWRKDWFEAVSWIERAADNGNAGAQFDLGMLARGPSRAVTFYRRAAAQGCAAAAHALGSLHSETWSSVGLGEVQGQGVEKNDASAMAYFLGGAERG